MAEHQNPRRPAAEAPAQVGTTIEHDVLRRDAEPGGADPRDHVGRVTHRVEIGGRRLALDECAQIREQEGEVHQSALGVARAPKCT